LRARRVVVELLLARAPHVPVVQRLAAVYGLERTDLLVRDESCILCGRCVRACALLGIHAIGFAERGSSRRVAVPFDRTSDVCIGCRACFHVCPTGAIEATLFVDRVHLPTWDLELERASCSRCGRPYVPERAWRFVQGMQPEYLRRDTPVCPECRRREQVLRIRGKDVDTGP
jgi:ferredoxin